VNLLLVHIARWRVPKENSKKHLEFWGWWMDWLRSHPEKLHFTKSRLFTFTEEGSSEENWMYIDDYEQREDFDKQWKAVDEDPELAKGEDEANRKLDAVIVPGSKKGDVWTEVEELKVELE
jgi:hypothetical protein